MLLLFFATIGLGYLLLYMADKYLYIEPESCQSISVRSSPFYDDEWTNYVPEPFGEDFTTKEWQEAFARDKASPEVANKSAKLFAVIDDEVFMSALPQPSVATEYDNHVQANSAKRQIAVPAPDFFWWTPYYKEGLPKVSTDKCVNVAEPKSWHLIVIGFISLLIWRWVK